MTSTSALLPSEQLTTKGVTSSDIVKVSPSLSSVQTVSSKTKGITTLALSTSEANVMLLLGICVGCSVLLVVTVLVFVVFKRNAKRETEAAHRYVK